MSTAARRPPISRCTGQHGSSLIELMVVMLIVAALMAVAVPGYLGAQGGQKDRNAQASLRVTVTAAQLLYLEAQDYTTVDADALAGTTSLTYNHNSVVSTSPTEVSVHGYAAGTFLAVTRSVTGACFAARDIPASGTTFGQVSGTCSAANAATEAGVPTADWVRSW
jgi:type IV pilus assembly protein PilA